MILRLLSLLALTCGCLSAASAQDSLNFPVLGETIRHAPELDALLAKDTPLHVISSGFDWTEGPVWVREKDGPGYLLFSDIPPNSVYKWVEGQGAKLFLKPSGFTGPGDYGAEPGSNGLLINSQGLLISCEHGDRRLSVLTKDGGKRTLVDNYEGKRLNSPNDVVQHSNGDLLFTDPPYGLPNRWEDPRRELDFCGVYRLTPQGQLTLLTKEMTRPPGPTALLSHPTRRRCMLHNPIPMPRSGRRFPSTPMVRLARAASFTTRRSTSRMAGQVCQMDWPLIRRESFLARARAACISSRQQASYLGASAPENALQIARSVELTAPSFTLPPIPMCVASRPRPKGLASDQAMLRDYGASCSDPGPNSIAVAFGRLVRSRLTAS